MAAISANAARWAGEILAERDYNVFDPEVLSAIRKHTTAHAVMTMLDMLVYVADAIEPGRKVFTGLNTLRALAARDLVAAAHKCAESSYRYNLSAGARCIRTRSNFLA